MGCVGSVLRAFGCAPIRGDPRQRPGASSKPREGRALGTYRPKTGSEKVNLHMPKELPKYNHQYHSVQARTQCITVSVLARTVAGPCISLRLPRPGPASFLRGA